MSHSLNSNRPKQSRAGVLRRSIPLAVAGITLALTSPFAASQKAAENLPPGAMQAKATTSCLECHEARIILQQRLSKGAWTKEVDKMIKWGAVVDANDHDALIDYLSTNFSPDQPAYDPPRTSIEKPSGKGGEKKGSR
jgi:mono/diheme cytochrome c family protein